MCELCVCRDMQAVKNNPDAVERKDQAAIRDAIREEVRCGVVWCRHAGCDVRWMDGWMDGWMHACYIRVQHGARAQGTAPFSVA